VHAAEQKKDWELRWNFRPYALLDKSFEEIMASMLLRYVICCRLRRICGIDRLKDEIRIIESKSSVLISVCTHLHPPPGNRPFVSLREGLAS
jgi:hypothetical protein